MKIFCVSFCVYLYLLQPTICQPADDSGFSPFGIAKGLFESAGKLKDGIFGFFGLQQEPESNDKAQPTETLDVTEPPVSTTVLHTKPPQQLNFEKPEAYKNYFVNSDPSTVSTSTIPSIPEVKALVEGKSCPSVNYEIRSCILFEDCEPYVRLLNGQNTDAAVVAMIRNAYCGLDDNKNPKVCCPPASEPSNPKRLTTYKDYFVPALPEPPVCGLSNASFDRVVGGVDAKLGDLPWMAILGYQDYDGAPVKWNCGGSLITSRHVLTACHCVWRREDSLKIVRLGELDLSRDDEGATPIDVTIKHMLKHENYFFGRGTDDLAILVLDKEIQFTDLIRPICLPIRPELRSNTFERHNPFVAGWGKLAWKGNKAQHLQVVQVPVVPNRKCKDYWTHVDESLICAGYDEGGKDSCEADSGGPLIQPVYNSKEYVTYFFETGVVSYGKECARPGIPGVYMRVTHYLPWILSKVVGDTSSLN